MRLPFRATVALALCLGLGLVALSTLAAYATIHALLDDTRQETQSQDAIITLKDVVSRFKTAESLQRRYLLTGRDDDLADYQRARLETQRTLQGLRSTRLSGEASRAGDDFKTLQALVAERLGLLEQVVATRQQAGLDAAIVRIDSEHHRQLHIAIEGLTTRIEAVEQAELARSADSTRQTARLVRQLVVAGGLLSLGLLVWALWMIMRAQARRHRVEAQLSESEALSRAVTEGMAEGVITTTHEGAIVAANSAARHLFAYRLEALQGQDVSMLLPERYRADFKAFFAAMLAREPGFRESGTAVSCRRSDGSEFPAQVSFGDVDVKGRRLYTAIIRDLTESRRIGQALRDSEAQLRQITDTVPALIACIDKHQRFEFHNKAYEEVFGLAADQIHQKTLLAVLGRPLYAQVHSHVREALMGYSVRYEREHATASGEQRAYVMHYFPRYAEVDGRDEVIGFFALGMDVTELKRIDRMKSEFVSTVSHELRTPLTSIRGSLGLVWGGVTGVLPEKAHNLVGIAKNNCERLIRLINDILDSEKIESGKMNFDLQPTDIGLLLEQTVLANEGFAAERQVALSLRTPRHRVQVQADSDRLTQVVTNLLSNAIKFSPAGAEVVVAVRTDPDPYARRVRVEIIDKGPGIPPEFQRRIFQKFSQADSSDTRQKGGTGLGLNISKAIIERMEGSIGFQTEINAGTTFFFDLPEWREAPPVTAPASLYPELRPRVLVCEDDADLAHLVGLMLDEGGFDVDTAHSLAQAKALLGSTRYCAMTVDLRLQQLSGLDLVREMRLDPRTRDLPVLVLSSSAAEVRGEGGHEALGIAAWLEKPLDAERLLACLRQAINQNRTAPPLSPCDQ